MGKITYVHPCTTSHQLSRVAVVAARDVDRSEGVVVGAGRAGLFLSVGDSFFVLRSR